MVRPCLLMSSLGVEHNAAWRPLKGQLIPPNNPHLSRPDNAPQGWGKQPGGCRLMWPWCVFCRAVRSLLQRNEFSGSFCRAVRSLLQRNEFSGSFIRQCARSYSATSSVDHFAGQCARSYSATSSVDHLSLIASAFLSISLVNFM